MITEKDIKPIPKYIIERIKQKDKHNFYNTRYYNYFTKIKGDLAQITVACKTHDKQWICKQVAVHTLHSNHCLVKDIDYTVMGIATSWYYQGISRTKKYSEGKWEQAEDRYYNIACDTVNKSYALKFKQFKYSMADKYKYWDIMKYLKLFEKYPQAEYLMKLGLQHFATKKSILNKIGKDKKFRKWIIQNKKILKNEYGNYPYFSTSTILDAYRQNFDLLTTFQFELEKRELMDNYHFKHFNDLIPNKEIPKFMEYLKTQDIDCALYDDYASACKFLNLDMSLPKNKYPHDFMRWHDIRINEKHSKEAEIDEEKRKQLYKQFAKVADKYLTLQRDKKDKYIMLIAKSPAELIKEGEKLHHCVGRMGYDQKFAKEVSLIFFIRTKEQPTKPLATLEYSLVNHKVLQCYADHDRKPSDEILNYVKRKWLPYANRKISKLNSKTSSAI